MLRRRSGSGELDRVLHKHDLSSLSIGFSCAFFLSSLFLFFLLLLFQRKLHLRLIYTEACYIIRVCLLLLTCLSPFFHLCLFFFCLVSSISS